MLKLKTRNKNFRKRNVTKEHFGNDLHIILFSKKIIESKLISINLGGKK